MSKTLAWYEVWFTTLTHPNYQTIINLINQPKISKERAYYWAFIGFVGFSVSFFLFYNNVTEGSLQFNLDYGNTVGTALIMLLGFVLITSLIQSVAFVLGGTGRREQLVYAFAAYTAPLGIISGVLSIFPYVRYMVFPLVIYGFMLNVLATRATYRLNWIKAIICNVIVFGAIFLCLISIYQYYLRL